MKEVVLKVIGVCACFTMACLMFSIGLNEDFFDTVIFLGFGIMFATFGFMLKNHIQNEYNNKIINIVCNIAVIIAILISVVGLFGSCSVPSYPTTDPIWDKSPTEWNRQEQQHFYDVYID